MLGFRWEPAAIAEALRLALIAAAIVGWIQLEETAILALVAAVSAILSLFVRQSVVSQNTLNQAGLTKEDIVQRAADPAVKPVTPEGTPSTK